MNSSIANLVIVGAGVVAQSLVEMLRKFHSLNGRSSELKIAAIVGSSRCLDFRHCNLSLGALSKSITRCCSLRQLVQKRGQDYADLEEQLASIGHSLRSHPGPAFLIDVSSATDVLALTRGIVSGGYDSFVTANKRNLVVDQWLYDSVLNKFRKHGITISSGACIGSGMAFGQYVRSLMTIGDKPTVIRAVLGGSINFVLSAVMRDVPLDRAVAQARQKHYFDPPHELKWDFSLIDIAWKALLLARLADMKLNLRDIAVRPFIKIPRGALSSSEARRVISQHNESVRRRVESAQAHGRMLRIVVEIRPPLGTVSVRLKSLAPTDPFFHVDGVQNAIQVVSKGRPQGEIHIGPGAGPWEVAGQIVREVLAEI